MTPDIVVDIGNSRMKWGLIGNGVVAKSVSLPYDDQYQWERQIAEWNQSKPNWAIASVSKEYLKSFSDWLKRHHWDSDIIDNGFLLREAKLRGFWSSVDSIELIGTDRLLTAFAAHTRKLPRTTAIAISVGTAMTVDFVRQDGEHVGGAILPGPYLMAESLHNYTSALPKIEIDPVGPVRIWGENTHDAIEVGIANAVLGSADHLVWDWVEHTQSQASVFVTGGDNGYFRNYKFTADVRRVEIDPNLTLEGLREIAGA